MVGPWPGALAGTPDFYRTVRAVPTRSRRAVTLVPARMRRSAATNRVGSHLSARRYVYSVPVLGRAEWVVIDTSDAWVPGTLGRSRRSRGAAGRSATAARAEPEVAEGVRRGRRARLPEKVASMTRPRATARTADVDRRRSGIAVRGARVGARGLARRCSLDDRSLRGRARRVRGLPARPLRPREHGAGGLEHDAGAPARVDGQRDGRADDPPRRPRRPVPRAARARVDGLAVAAVAGARPDRRRLARRASRLLAGAASPRERRAGRAARARIPRLPVGRDERVRSDPSRDVRDHVPALLRLVPRDATGSSRSRSSRCSRCRRASSWGLPDHGPRDLVRVRSRAAPRRAPRSPLSASPGPPSRSTSSCRTTGTATTSSSASTTRSAARRRASCGCSSRIRGRCSARSSRATTSPICSGSASRCSGCSSSRRGSQPSRCRSCLRTGSRTSAR